MLDRKDFLNDFDFNRARFDAIHRGDFHLPFIPRPVRIKILMVSDGSPGSSKLLTPINCAAASWATLGLARLVPNKP